jgi:hypothetical protein
MPAARRPPTGDVQRDRKRERDRERYQARRDQAAAAPADEGQVAPIGAGFGALASIESLQDLGGRVRLAGTGSSAVVSVIDSIQLVMQGNEQDARNSLYPMIDTYGVDSDVIGFPNVFPESIPPQFQEKIRDGGLPIWWHQFPGQGQRPTPVTSPKGLLEILALLPGRTPAAIRRAAFDTLARVLGGDASLVDDVLKMRRVQDVLGETDPTNPLRTFGQAAEERPQQRAFSEAVLGVAALFGSPPETLVLQSDEWCRKRLEDHAAAQEKVASKRDYAECKQVEATAQRSVSNIQIARAEATEARAKARKANAEARMAETAAGLPPPPEPRAAVPQRRPRRTAGLPVRGEENIESLRSAPVPPGRADDPDLEAYRNAGIPDDALPVSVEEAERWRVLAAKWKQRAIQFRTGRVIILVPRGSVGYDGEPSRPTQWEPVARALAV